MEVVKQLVKSIKKMQYKIEKKVKFQKKVKISLKSDFEGNNVIGYNSIVSNAKIGFGTYIGANSYIVNTQIGRYCSIASNVRTVNGIHPTKEFVSTHPAFFSTAGQAGFTYVKDNKFNEHKYIDESRKLSICIENDVWIGDNVLILEGIHIGNGAIVGAGAVVTKDVEPYSINVGVPAKKIGYRFEREQIHFLNYFKWWNKDEEWIRKNIENFRNVSIFMNEMEKSNNE